MDNLDFHPTKTWIREHRSRPKNCPDKDCLCVIHFTDDSCGFCSGHLLNDCGNLDVISLCHSCYDSQNQAITSSHVLLHPAEVGLLSMALTWSVSELWMHIPEYRSQLFKMKRKRTRDIDRLRKAERLGGEENGSGI